MTETVLIDTIEDWSKGERLGHQLFVINVWTVPEHHAAKYVTLDDRIARECERARVNAEALIMDMTGLKYGKPEPRPLAKRKQRLSNDEAERVCRAEVWRLYGRTCAIPGCKERAEHQHHLVYRSKSKRLKFDPTNRAPLCSGHHRLVHDGIIWLKREADGELIVTGPKAVLSFKL